MIPSTVRTAKTTTILLVDDDRRLLQSLQARLNFCGYNCIAHDNAAEAITQLSVSDVHLVITDLTMPGIDGLGFISMIRNYDAIPLIVITGQPSRAYELAGFQNVHLIQKPFEMEELLKHVRSFSLEQKYRCPAV